MIERDTDKEEHVLWDANGLELEEIHLFDWSDLLFFYTGRKGSYEDCFKTNPVINTSSKYS